MVKSAGNHPKIEDNKATNEQIYRKNEETRQSPGEREGNAKISRNNS